MKKLEIALPDQLAKEMEGLVSGGWFANEEELARLALTEFLSHQRFRLQEEFQSADIRWALDLKSAED